MESNNEEKWLILRDPGLLSIFQSDEDVHGHDVLKMNDIFGNCLQLVQKQMELEHAEDPMAAITPELIGSIATFINGVQTMKSSTLLIGNLDALGKDIKQKIKKNIYHIATSNKINGDFRAAVVDGDNQIKAQITLRQAQFTPSTLTDINSLAMQAALQQISDKLDTLTRDVTYLVQFARRQSLQTPFLNARSALMEVKHHLQDDSAVRSAVSKATDYLREGLNSLYGDLNDNLNEFMRLRNSAFGRIEDIDKCLSYIAEDMNLIPKYVGLRAYLFSYMDDGETAADILHEYQRRMNELLIKDNKPKSLSPAECLHKYFPYSEDNRDFWVTDFKQLNKQLQQIPILEEADNREVYYISAKEEKHD